LCVTVKTAVPSWSLTLLTRSRTPAVAPVEFAGELVREQHSWLVATAAAMATRCLPARQLPGGLSGSVGESDFIEQLTHPSANLGRRARIETQAQRDVAPHVEERMEVVPLENDADLKPSPARPFVWR
jgi:hypothetical protein